MEKLKAIWQRVTAFWGGLTHRGRIGLAAGVSVGLVAALALMVFGSRGPTVDTGQQPDKGRITQQAVKRSAPTAAKGRAAARARTTVRAPAKAKTTVARTTTARKPTKAAWASRKAAKSPTKAAWASRKAAKSPTKAVRVQSKVKRTVMTKVPAPAR